MTRTKEENAADAADEEKIQNMRKAIVNDWFWSCLGDRDFLHSLLEERADALSEEEVIQAYEDAELHFKEDA